MRVFIIGVTGRTGRLLARELISRGDVVHGLVRSTAPAGELAAGGVTTVLGNITDLDAHRLAGMLGDTDALVYAAGSNGGSREVTSTVDGEGVRTALAAADDAEVDRFLLLSVLPEAWRERELPPDEEYYFHVKKAADVAVTRSASDWVILRPSLLHDGPATGTVTLGPAVMHRGISRSDVAASMAEILHEPRITRRILELDDGATPLRGAVRAVADESSH